MWEKRLKTKIKAIGEKGYKDIKGPKSDIERSNDAQADEEADLRGRSEVKKAGWMDLSFRY